MTQVVIFVLQMLAIVSFMNCFLLVDGDGDSCVLNLTHQQSCKIVSDLVTENSGDARVGLYNMVKSIYERVLERDKIDYSTQLSRKGADIELGNQYIKDYILTENQNIKDRCAATEDEELWAILKYRIDTRIKQAVDLQGRNQRLADKYQQQVRVHAHQLVTLQQLQRKHLICQTTRTQLLTNLTDLSHNMVAIQNSTTVNNAEILELRNKLVTAKSEHTECRRSLNDVFTVLAHVPGLTPRSGKGSFKASNVSQELKQKLANFSSDVQKQQSIIDVLKQELVAVKAYNDKLLSDMHTTTEELQAGRVDCLRNLSNWKEKYHTEAEKFSSLEITAKLLASQTPDFCLTTVSASFCSFEVTDVAQNETCWFERRQTADFNWKVISNSRLSRWRRFRSITDHTCASSQGRLLFLDLSRLRSGQRAQLTTRPLYGETSRCFSFWYNIEYASHYGQFYALVLMKSERSWFGSVLRVWNANLVVQRSWQFASFEIPKRVASEGYKIQFVAEGYGQGYVGLDDLGFTAGPCLKS